MKMDCLYLRKLTNLHWWRKYFLDKDGQPALISWIYVLNPDESMVKVYKQGEVTYFNIYCLLSPHIFNKTENTVLLA